MSDTTHISAVPFVRSENTCTNKCLSRFWKTFSLDGHISYAFIYGSWEIIRARKVGTTHTKVDYVVYRLFYPVILIGTSLFAIVAQNNLTKFFLLFEVWIMILQIIYAFVFLQNVLANNLHRENVKHRQKIPERLVVTDEIEKGGHKFYICKRYSILPTEKLYYTERFIWLLFNVLVTLNVGTMLAHMAGIVPIEFDYKEDVERIRTYSMGFLMLADVILTPIPMRILHFVFPFLFYSLYHLFLFIIFQTNELIIYSNFNRTTTGGDVIIKRYLIVVASLILLHCALTGLAKLRDYIISLLDDSRTPKQQQNLRNQKRLARRKLMNYIEGPDGRVTGISLEKHTFVPGLDEFIKTDKDHKRKNRLSGEDNLNGDASSDDEELQEIKMFRKSDEGAGDTTNVADVDQPEVIPVTAKVQPPPKPRYSTPEKDVTRFSSSSSSRDEMEVVQSTISKLPSVPQDTENENGRSSKDNRRSSQVPLHQFGVLVKPRDSKENIHQRMDTAEESPPTPPFVKLVQTLIKLKKETKQEVELERKIMKAQNNEADGRAVHTAAGSALVKVVRVVRAEEEKKRLIQPKVGLRGRPLVETRLDGTPKPRNIETRVIGRKRGRAKVAPQQVQQQEDDEIDRLIKAAVSPKILAAKEAQDKKDEEKKSEGSSKQTRQSFDSSGRLVAPRVIHIKGQNLEIPNQGSKKELAVPEFHKELTDKLQKEQNKRLGIPNKDQKKKVEKKPSIKKTRLKSILKHRDGLDTQKEYLLQERIKRRENRLLRRREERAMMGKHGKPVYDPLSIPESENDGRLVVETNTTFHYLGTRLKGEKVERTTVPADEVPLYKTHPGIGTTDDAEVKEDNGKPIVEQAKSLVTFHPLVKYFDVNEVEVPPEKRDKKKLRWERKF